MVAKIRISLYFLNRPDDLLKTLFKLTGKHCQTQLFK